jgi:hypothetical protein
MLLRADLSFVYLFWCRLLTMIRCFSRLLDYLECSAPLLECKSLLVQVVSLVHEQLDAFSTLQNTL